MSCSDRFKRIEAVTATGVCLVAIIGLVWLIYLIGISNGEQSERREAYPKAYTQTAKQAAQSACLGADPGAVFECVIEHVEASQETTYAEQDLTAQQRAAWSALLGAGASIAALIVSMLGVWYVKRTLDATLKAVQDTGLATEAMLAANEIARNAQRPWIKIEKIFIEKIALKESGNGHNFSVGIKIDTTNVGQTPAMEVYCICTVWLNDILSVNFIEWQKSWESAHFKAKQRYEICENTGRIMFPSDDHEFGIVTNTDLFTPDNAISVDLSFDRPFRIFVTASIFYKFGGQTASTVSTAVIPGSFFGDWEIGTFRSGPELMSMWVAGSDSAT